MVNSDYRPVVAIACAMAVFGCTRAVDRRAGARAERFAHAVLILDGHIDVPYRLYHKSEDVSVRTESGEFDYPRARRGGLDAFFMSIYTPSALETRGGARERADTLIDGVEALARRHPDKFAVATSPAQVEANFARGVMSLCLGMENGSPIEGDPGNLRHFYDRGVRYITLTHALDNHICDSSYDTTRTWYGVSPFGRTVVAEMNRLGIMVDVSHLSDDALWQVLALTKAPVIASHSSCRRFVPGFERNVSDDMIRGVAENGGVIQINFGSSFVTSEANHYHEELARHRKAYLHEHHYSEKSPEAKEFTKRYIAEHPYPFATVADIADHIDHVVALAGVDHVGFGSDFDGVGDTLPVGLKDVSGYPNLIGELLKRGYTEADVEKIASGNVLRAWREVERIAAAH